MYMPSVKLLAFTFQTQDWWCWAGSDLCHRWSSSPVISLCRDHTEQKEANKLVGNGSKSAAFCWRKASHSHSAIVVFGLQVCGSDHINPDQALLWTTIWQLSELPRWGSNTRVVRQRVHFEWALQNKEINKRTTWYNSLTRHPGYTWCLLWNDWSTLNSPTTVGSSSPFSFFPRCSLKVSQKSVSPLNSGTSSRSQSYT